MAAAPSPATCRKRRRDCLDTPEVFDSDSLSFFTASSLTPLLVKDRVFLCWNALFLGRWCVILAGRASGEDERSDMLGTLGNFTFEHHADAKTLVVYVLAFRGFPRLRFHTLARNQEPPSPVHPMRRKVQIFRMSSRKFWPSSSSSFDGRSECEKLFFWPQGL